MNKKLHGIASLVIFTILIGVILFLNSIDFFEELI